VTPTLVACAAIVAACGGEPAGGGRPPRADDAQSQVAVSLAITVSDGQGSTQHATLTCRNGRASKTGFLAGDPRAVCRRARQLAHFLASQPDRNRICTQIYGGPETARIHGTIGTRRVDRRFSRTNGCEIEDWNRAKTLLTAKT
jgi:hypothetical protein